MDKRVKITKHEGYHFLWIDGDLWMWDVPQEVVAQKQLAELAIGDVLIVGYGLGLLQNMVIGKVNSLMTIEKEPGVLTENERTFKTPYCGSVIVGDFFDLPTSPKFDTVIGDIWLEINEVYLNDYLKFREHAEQMLKPGGKVVAWGQDCFEMWEKKRC